MSGLWEGFIMRSVALVLLLICTISTVKNATTGEMSVQEGKWICKEDASWDCSVTAGVNNFVYKILNRLDLL